MENELVLYENSEYQDFVNLFFDDSEYFDDYEFQSLFELVPSLRNFGLMAIIDTSKPLEEQLKNRQEFDQFIKKYEMYSKDELSEDKTIDETINYLKEHFDNLLDNFEYVKFRFENTDILEYIKKNPVLLTKKLVLGEYVEISEFEKIEQLLEKYKGIEDKIYVLSSGNSHYYTSLVDCRKTMEVIKQKAEIIKKLNLSPMETIMYVYDQVRNRVYTKETEMEGTDKSRALSQVLFGDRIVCVGYANMLSALLRYIGIDCFSVGLTNKTYKLGNHERNMIYVKDPKYNIDGAYYFDSTWDSKRENETNEFLYRYICFGKTRRQMEALEEKRYEYDIFDRYPKNMLKTIRKHIEDGNYEKINQYAQSINYMGRIILGRSIVNRLVLLPMHPDFGKFDKEQLLKDLEYVIDKFDQEIPGETMIQLLNNVRKIEYYINPEFYPYTVDDMYVTYKKSGWKLGKQHIDSYQALLGLLFNEKVELEDLENFVNFVNEEKLGENVEQVRLTKTLRLIYENKKNNMK